jgi:hypothetical protein
MGIFQGEKNKNKECDGKGILISFTGQVQFMHFEHDRAYAGTTVSPFG